MGVRGEVGIVIDEQEIVCHALVRPDRVLLPLHAIVRDTLTGSGTVRYRSAEIPLAALNVEITLPALDLLVCSYAKSLEPFRPEFAGDELAIGTPVEIELFSWSPEGLVPTVIASCIDDLIEVSSYEYRTAEGVRIAVEHARMFSLATSLPRGTSGAPVRRARDRATIGTVHGNLSRGFRSTLILAGSGTL